MATLLGVGLSGAAFEPIQTISDAHGMDTCSDSCCSQVVEWLDSLPSGIEFLERSHRVGKDLKRRRSSSPDDSSSKRQLISPPSSEPKWATNKMSGEGSSASSAEEQSSQEIDHDKTPKAKGKQHVGVRRAASTSSRDSSDSRGSKRTKSSGTTPMKLWDLSGPNSHTLLREDFSVLENIQAPTLRDLLDDFQDINRCVQIMPRKIRDALSKHGVRRLTNGMFFDDDAVAEPSAFDSDALVLLALRIKHYTNTCIGELVDEATWNSLVHVRVLDLCFQDMKDGLGQDLVDFMPCTTINMNPLYHRFREPTSRVDFIARLPAQPEDAKDKKRVKLDGIGMPLLNWTTNQTLPIAFSIETKRHTADMNRGSQQLGIWNAAHWEYLIHHAGMDAVKKLDFIPGVVVHAETWHLVITTRDNTDTTVFPGISFGNTRDAVGVFQVVAGLRRLRHWTLEVLWPWYKENMPGFKPETSVEEQQDTTMAEESQTTH
ncbi:hypothetical protein FLAG1_10464 [Fusarium langsethiae]|uniref:PD-(D/E)XK nuclease-like domain-containing protein n=1 Tax=Fusarium langsethiae TaxID=179993 RepID=A0A0M9ENN7_FUSLA|nr:hypothetical protein FLAG1_10464 [Fusarium langsethiae]GKU16695.1 unnamed protein product [Fusarium langsethiae]GKU16765.1 unnamed protein product [Fusarium langsethiae]